MSDVILTGPSQVARDYLIGDGVGFTYVKTKDWSVARNSDPKLPINVIVVFDEDAQKIVRGHGGGMYERPVVRIDIRSKKYSDGDYKSRLVLIAMDALSDYTWTGDSNDYSQRVVVQTASRTRGIFPLGKNENKQYVFNMEYALVIDSITDL